METYLFALPEENGPHALGGALNACGKLLKFDWLLANACEKNRDTD